MRILSEITTYEPAQASDVIDFILTAAKAGNGFRVRVGSTAVSSINCFFKAVRLLGSELRFTDPRDLHTSFSLYKTDIISAEIGSDEDYSTCHLLLKSKETVTITPV